MREITPLEHLHIDVGSVEDFVEHPVLIETSGGVFGATVTTPKGDPRAALAILVGMGEERSGANMMWRTLARTLASLDVVVLRCDTAGVCDSHLSVEGEQGDLANLEVVRWFAREVAEVPLILLGYCNGTAGAVRLAVEDPVPLAIGLVTPPGKLFAPIPPGGARRLKARVGSWFNKDSNMPTTEEPHELALLLDQTPARASTWILTGTEDRSYEMAQQLVDSGRHGSRLVLEVVDGVEVHWFSTPTVQHEAIGRMVRWVQRVLSTIKEEKS